MHSRDSFLGRMTGSSVECIQTPVQQFARCLSPTVSLSSCLRCLSCDRLNSELSFRVAKDRNLDSREYFVVDGNRKPARPRYVRVWLFMISDMCTMTARISHVISLRGEIRDISVCPSSHRTDDATLPSRESVVVTWRREFWPGPREKGGPNLSAVSQLNSQKETPLCVNLGKKHCWAVDQVLRTISLNLQKIENVFRRGSVFSSPEITKYRRFADVSPFRERLRLNHFRHRLRFAVNTQSQR